MGGGGGAEDAASSKRSMLHVLRMCSLKRTASVAVSLRLGQKDHHTGQSRGDGGN